MVSNFYTDMVKSSYTNYNKDQQGKAELKERSLRHNPATLAGHPKGNGSKNEKRAQGRGKEKRDMPIIVTIINLIWEITNVTGIRALCKEKRGTSNGDILNIYSLCTDFRESSNRYDYYMYRQNKF
jgi:hypothetical protein